MSLGLYILDSRGHAMACDNMAVWGRWMQDNHELSRVARDTVAPGIDVSTVFLGLDKNFSGSGSPILWETMVLGGSIDQEQERCSGNREQAEAMHANMVERVLAVEALKL